MDNKVIEAKRAYHREKQREWREKNKEKVQAYQRAYQKQYRKDNAERLKRDTVNFYERLADEEVEQ